MRLTHPGVVAQSGSQQFQRGPDGSMFSRAGITLSVKAGQGQLLRDQGRPAEARALLAPVYAAFTEGFGFPDLVEARTLLEELGNIGSPSS